jgi:hypothetical protein
MKTVFVVIALAGAASSLLILGFSRMSMELDKRIPISIVICAALLLLTVTVFARRVSAVSSIGFAVVGVMLVGSFSVRRLPPLETAFAG